MAIIEHLASNRKFRPLPKRPPQRHLYPLSRPQYRDAIKHPTERELQSLRRRLGHAAKVGGIEYVERIAYSDDVFLRLSARSRKAAVALIARLAAKAPKEPPQWPTATPNSRVKIRWSDELKARVASLAPRYPKDAVELTKQLGLPACCVGAIRRAALRLAKRNVDESVQTNHLRLAA